MKFKFKTLIYVIIICIILSNIAVFNISAEDNAQKLSSFEEKIADTELPDLTVQTSTSNTRVADDVYYINSKINCDYLYNLTTSPSRVSGSTTNLGISILWYITNENGGCTIKSASNPNKYLAVSTTSTNSAIVEFVTLTSSTIPTECLWNVTTANGGGCLIQSVYNSRYLFPYGSTVRTTNTLGTSGSSTYDTNVWRVISLDNMSGRELTSSSHFPKLNIMVGTSNSLYYRLAPSNAIWATKSDFSLYGYNSSIISVDSDSWTVTGLSVGETQITCKHKVTDLIFIINVRVLNTLNNKGTLSYWADVESNKIGYWNTSSIKIYKEKVNSNANFYFSDGYSQALSTWNSALGINISTSTTKDNVEIQFYGGTLNELVDLGMPEDSTVLGYTESYSDYTGYYTYNNSIKLELELKSATIYILDISSSTIDMYKNVCTHELGHGLGFSGHSLSSSDVMYPYGSSIYTLRPLEKNHLIQMYD